MNSEPITATRMNGHHHNRLQPAELTTPPKGVLTEQQKLAIAIESNASLQGVLATVSTPAGKILKTISKALGRAEAEIEFTETIRYRED